MINISIALYNTEINILKADPSDLDDNSDKITNFIMHRNPFINRLMQGQRDEKFVQDYYEVLKKADKFIRTATPLKYATTADKHSMSYGMKDKWGRRFEHYGFFDEKHRHAGKTLGEVMQMEMEERRLKDDNLPIVYMFNNTPIEEGIVKTFDKELKMNENGEYEGMNTYEKSKLKKFPIMINRVNDNVNNKIEQITDFLHVKRLDDTHRYFEFYIPKKYKLGSVPKDSTIFKQIITFDEIWVRGQYGELISFHVYEFKKHVDADEHYEVLKFYGIEMQQVGLGK
jgi:hypothetical protein